MLNSLISGNDAWITSIWLQPRRPLKAHYFLHCVLTQLGKMLDFVINWDVRYTYISEYASPCTSKLTYGSYVKVNYRVLMRNT